MDTSINDPLNDTPTLPELSFNDLIDDSPMKQANSLIYESDEDDTYHNKDDTLNTPRPKKPIITAMKIVAAAPNSSASIKKDGNLFQNSTILPSNAKAITAQSIIINNKNIMPKTGIISGSASNQLMRIAPKPTITTVSTTTNAGVVATGKGAISGQIIYLPKSTGGMQAIRLQSTTKSPNSLPTNTVSTDLMKSKVTNLSGSKTVAIQVIRASNGTLVPLKSTNASVGLSSATIKPKSINISSQLVGKKLVSSTGTPIVIKSAINTTDIKVQKIQNTTKGTISSPTRSTIPLTGRISNTAPVLPTTGKISTNTGQISTIVKKPNTLSTALPTVVGKTVTNSTVLPTIVRKISTTSTNLSTTANKSMTSPQSLQKTGKILVQANGKQIMLSNQNLIKFTSKPAGTAITSTTTTSIITSTTTTATVNANNSGGGGGGVGGQLRAIQIPGKEGVQYLRVLTNQKSTVATTNTTNSISTTTAITTVANTKVTTIASPTTKSLIPTSSNALVRATAISNSSLTAVKPVKIMNASSMPSKFAVIRQGGGVSNIILTQSPKKPNIDGGTITSYVGPSKKFVTMSSLRAICGPETDSNSILSSPNKNVTLTTTSSSSSTLSPISSASTASPSTSAMAIISSPTTKLSPLIQNNATAGSLSLLRSNKITDINTQIKRITVAATGIKDKDDNIIGTKKIISTTGADGNRILLMPRGNNKLPTLQARPQTIVNRTTYLSINDKNKTNLNNNNFRFTNSTSSSFSESFTNSINNLNKNISTKPSSSSLSSSSNVVITSAQPGKKLFSILKSNNNTNDNEKALTAAEMKSLVICGKAQALITQQQQFKIVQYKQGAIQSSATNVTTGVKISPQRLVIINNNNHNNIDNNIKLNNISNNNNNANTNISNKNNNQAMSKFAAPKMLQGNAIEKEVPEVSNVDEDAGGVRRKHCNCSKSQCLKLYCDCFANGEFCKDCTCKDCFNNLENEDERQRAIKSCLDRNPAAFKPKITTARDQSDTRLHNKGCNCKRSGCLKNYCECYEAKIPCSSNCKCVGCRNVEDRPDVDMDSLDQPIQNDSANGVGVSVSVSGTPTKLAGYKRTYDKMKNDIKKDTRLARIKLSFDKKFNITEDGGPPAQKPKLGTNIINTDVIDATIQCLISQAIDCERNGLSIGETEHMVIEELGRCLVEIIDFSLNTTDHTVD